jgi:hypothetical protein
MGSSIVDRWFWGDVTLMSRTTCPSPLRTLGFYVISLTFTRHLSIAFKSYRYPMDRLPTTLLKLKAARSKQDESTMSGHHEDDAVDGALAGESERGREEEEEPEDVEMGDATAAAAAATTAGGEEATPTAAAATPALTGSSGSTAPHPSFAPSSSAGRHEDEDYEEEDLEGSRHVRGDGTAAQEDATNGGDVAMTDAENLLEEEDSRPAEVTRTTAGPPPPSSSSAAAPPAAAASRKKKPTLKKRVRVRFRWVVWCLRVKRSSR